jgi:hypothetical protein
LIEDVRYPLEPLWTPGNRPVVKRIDDLVDRAWQTRDELAALLATEAFAQRAAAARNFAVLDSLVRTVRA